MDLFEWAMLDIPAATDFDDQLIIEDADPDTYRFEEGDIFDREDIRISLKGTL